MQETWDMGLISGLRRSPEEGMATHSSILVWRVPWKEEPGGLQSMGSQRVGHDWSNLACTHALEKDMATHSSVLAWRIPGTEEPGGLPSMGSHRVGHDWRNLAAAAAAAEEGLWMLEEILQYLIRGQRVSHWKVDGYWCLCLSEICVCLKAFPSSLCFNNSCYSHIP